MAGLRANLFAQPGDDNGWLNEQLPPSPTIPTQAPVYLYDQTLDPASRGLRRGIAGAQSTIQAAGAQLAEPFSQELANEQFTAANQRLQDAYTRYAPEVNSWNDVEVGNNLLPYLGGALGEGIPSTLAALAGATAGKGLAVLGGMKGIVPSLVGGATGVMPMEAGDIALNMHNDPQTQAGTTPYERLGYALAGGAGNAALEAAPEALAIDRLFGGGKRLARGIAPMLGGAAGSVAAGIGGEALTGGAQEAVSELVQGHARGDGASLDNLNWDSIKEAAIKEGVGGGIPGAIGGAGRVAHSLLTPSAQELQAVGGLLKRGAGAASDAVNGAELPGAEQLGQKVGELGDKIGKTASDLNGWLDEKALSGANDDVRLLTSTPKSPNGAVDTDWLHMDDTKRNEAATRLAQQYATDDNAPTNIRNASAQYLQGTRTGDAWAPFAVAAREHERGKLVSNSIDLVTKSFEKAGIRIGKAASDFKAGVEGSRQNAQEVAGDSPTFDDLFNKELFKAAKTKGDTTSAYIRIAKTAPYIKQWIANGFAATKGGEVIVPEGLTEIYDDPSAVLKTAADMMQREGLAHETVGSRLEQVLAELKSQQDAALSADELMALNLTPTAAARYKFSQKRGDLRRLAAHIESQLTTGKLDEAKLKELFGPNTERVLEALSRSAKTNVKYEHQQTDRVIGESDGANADDAEQVTAGEEIGGITDYMHPNTDAPKVMYHHYNPIGETPYSYANMKHLEHAQSRLARSVGDGDKSMRPMGAVDAAREKYQDDPLGLDFALQSLREKHEGKALEQINAENFVLRSETMSDKSDPVDIPGAEFASITPQSQADKTAGKKSGNVWAIDTGKNNEFGGPERGTLWFERVNAEGDTKQFATSASRIITRMREGMKDIGGERQSGLIDQHDMLMQGISSFLSSKNAEGRNVLSGRVGIMRNGEVQWLGEGQSLPKDFKLPTGTLGQVAIERKVQAHNELVTTMKDWVEANAEKRPGDAAEVKEALKLNDDKKLGLLRDKLIKDGFGENDTRAKDIALHSEKVITGRQQTISSTVRAETNMDAGMKLPRGQYRTKAEAEAEAVKGEHAVRAGNGWAISRDIGHQVEERQVHLSESEEMAAQESAAHAEKLHTSDEHLAGLEVQPKESKQALAAAKAKLEAGLPSEKQVSWLVDNLRKGIPAFSAAVKALSAERVAAVKETLSAMLKAVSPDAPIWRGKPPANMTAFATRARAALARLDGYEPPPGSKPESAEAKLAEDMRGYDPNNPDAGNAAERESAAKAARQSFKVGDTYTSTGTGAVTVSALMEHAGRQLLVHKAVLTDAQGGAGTWGVTEPETGLSIGQGFSTRQEAMKRAEARLKDISDEVFLATIARSVSKRESKQTTFGDLHEDSMSQEEIQAVMDDIVRRLGPDITIEFAKIFGAANADGIAKEISGDWTENLIRISLSAMNPRQIAAHESMHELFSRLTQSANAGARKVQRTLLNAANSGTVLRQLERLLVDHPAALEQIKEGAPHYEEERLAYMFQFHQAGLLVIGPETKTLFQKIINVLRRIIGLLSEDQKAEKLLTAFDQGELQNADAAAEVMAKLENRERMINSMVEFTKPLFTKLGAAVLSVEDQLTATKNPALVEIAQLFKNPTAESGAKQAYFEAHTQQQAYFMNKLNAYLDQHQPKDVELAMRFLREGDSAKAKPVIRDAVAEKIYDAVRSILDEMAAYMHDAGVQRLTENGTWVDFHNVKEYFPHAFDIQVIGKNPGKFMADLLARHEADLTRIANSANVAILKGEDLENGWAAEQAKAEGRKVTAEDVAMAITNRLIASYGQMDLDETIGSVGFSPFMRAVNQRSLTWLDTAALSEYMNNDLVNVLVTYIAQGTKRAEYTRRFGQGGAVLQHLMGQAYEHEMYEGIEKQFGVKLDRKETLGALRAQKILAVINVARANTEAGDPITSEDVTALQEEVLAGMKQHGKNVMAMEGTLGYDIDPTNRRIQGNLLVYQNIRTMGLSIFSQVIDPLGIIVRGGTMQDAWKAYQRGVKEIWASWQGKHLTDREAQIAEFLGTVDASGFLANFGQMYHSMYLNGKIRNMNEQFFRWNGMEGFNRAMRIQGTQAAIGFLKRHKSLPEGQVSTDYLAELNLTPEDIVVDANGDLDYTDQKIREALFRWVNGAVLRPNAAQRPAWMSDPHYMLFGQFKQFNYTFHDTIMKRVWKDAKRHGNLGPMATMLATFVPAMIAADAAKAMLLTGSEPGWMQAGLPSMINHGVNRAGLFGIAQPFSDMLQPHHSVAGMFGPTMDQLSNMITEPFADSVQSALPGASIVNTVAGGDNLLDFRSAD